MKTIATLFLLVSAFQSLSVILCLTGQPYMGLHSESIMGERSFSDNYLKDPWKRVCEDYLERRPPFNQYPSGSSNNPQDFENDNRQPNFPQSQFPPQLQAQFQGSDQPSQDPRDLTPIRDPGYLGPRQLQYLGQKDKYSFYNVSPHLIEYPRASESPRGDISLTSPPADNDTLKIIAKSNNQAITIGDKDKDKFNGLNTLKTGSPGDLFIFKKSLKNPGTYNIYCKNNQTHGFDVYGGSSNPGNKIIIYRLTDHINEQFQVTPYQHEPKYFKLYSDFSKSCLQIGNDGRLEISVCNGSDNQRFQLVKPAN